MNITFDYQTFTQQPYGGISKYICELASELNNIGHVHAEIFAPLAVNKYLSTTPGLVWNGAIIPNFKIKKPFIIANEICSRIKWRHKTPDVIHETYYSRYTKTRKAFRTVLTVHDMIHEKFFPKTKKNIQFIGNKKSAILRADHIICVSECTKKDLLSTIALPEEKVTVVYHGISARYNRNKLKSRNTFVTPYLLYVGSRSGYKNFENLVRAYGASTWLQENVKLLCFGGGKFRKHEYLLMSELGIKQEKVTHEAGDDSHLYNCYENAVALVYPSVYEGFGMPLLESMSMNCPVTCSNSGSLPEVAGDAALFFDPQNIESMTCAIIKIIQDSSLRIKLEGKAKKRLKLFSWAKCAQETLDVYTGLL